MLSHGFSQRIPSSYLPNNDVIPLPPKVLPPPGESYNQSCSHPDTFLCTCIIHLGQGYSGLHSSFSFWRVNNSSSPNTCTLNTSYTPVHMSKVSVHEECLTSILVRIQPLHHLMHVYSTNFVLLFKMVDWTFDDALAVIQSWAFNTNISRAKCGWSLFRGHTLHQDSNYIADLDRALHSSREMGRGWKLQSWVHDWRWLQPHHHHFDPFKFQCRGYSTGKHKHQAYCLMMHGTSGAYLHQHQAHQVCSFPDEGTMAVLRSHA